MMGREEGVRVALVAVVCDETHDVDQPACYWTFVRQMGRSGHRVWVESSREGSLVELVDGEPRHRDVRPTVVKILDANGNRVRGLSATAGARYMRKFEIKCEACKFTLPAPAELIEPVFDQIAASGDLLSASPESGAPQIGLRSLAAMVRS